jgi:hypothetical protein
MAARCTDNAALTALVDVNPRANDKFPFPNLPRARARGAATDTIFARPANRISRFKALDPRCFRTVVLHAKAAEALAAVQLVCR